MSKLPLLVIAVTVLTSLSACSGEPWTLSRSSHEITMRWYNGDVPYGQVAADAGEYCSGMGKAAQFGDIERDGSAAIGHYRCI
ncbi:MAG TPA: hypothetical protein VMI30_07665 [Stellaceae bacterium]|nr:hypothetical protein [Stellaceae bacterium]